jgi:hypothetical protein
MLHNRRNWKIEKFYVKFYVNYGHKSLNGKKLIKVWERLILSPLLFIIYMNKIMKNWRSSWHGNISISKNFKNAETMTFWISQVLLVKSQHDLQYSSYNLNNIATEFFMEWMAFMGTEPIRSKVCSNDRILE